MYNKFGIQEMEFLKPLPLQTFTLKMAAVVFEKPLENLQHLMRFIPES
jgi:hypothetical protein